MDYSDFRKRDLQEDYITKCHELQEMSKMYHHVLKARVGIKEAIKYYEKSIKDVEEKDKQVLLIVLMIVLICFPKNPCSF